ncbi:MAG: 1-deoxy-D-xylulose-5-phosphate synthase [Bacteroidaceae bacterium]|nr:1-deoxy-D-xylulose-5-phosphate synthase [Bacteroidaceae bacterium]MCI6802507.1 1-deoxy-D-xylulose-5-phosphate synthase [Prevotellaceae bacterium]
MVDSDDYKYLRKIDYPVDLRKLKVEELPAVCDELRRDIIEELAMNPGHLASSLGVVELTVALHYVFNTPYDRIVWDVGHQAYGHKILTGRRDLFCTNRKLNGLKPFPHPDESEYDSFCCGHASNSISAALGMAVAAKMKGEDRKVVAVIGDGAMSGGLAFEGINNTASTPNDMLIVLNDNNMSIDRSVGGMRKYLLRLTTNTTYNTIRYRVSQRLLGWGILNEKRRRGLIRFSNSLKSVLSRQKNIFEGMDIRYFGPAEGNDVVELVRILQVIKEMKGPKLLYIHTTKGYGYAPAEEDATIWHAPGKFDPDTGERIKNDDGKPHPPKFQEVFGKTLLELAQQNPKIVGVTPAMPTGCSMNIMMNAMPERVFDVGIAEGHAVTFSGGMAKDGLLPFCNIYSSFMQRAYDNIIHDAATMRLNMVLCLDRAGLVGEDGSTHHGAFDLAFLRPIPNLTIASPYDEPELRRLMYTAQLPDKGVFVIRYPRGRGNTVDWQCELEEIPVGKGRKLKDGRDIAVLSLGPIGVEASKAIAIAELRSLNDHPDAPLHIAQYDMRFLKPLDKDLLHEVGRNFKKVVTVEDGVISGGLGSAVLEFFSDNGYEVEVKRIGIPDKFVMHGTVAELRQICGMDAQSISEVLV